jgi:hypothetical protein
VIAIHEPMGRVIVKGRLEIEQLQMLHRQSAEELGVVLLEADRIGDDASPGPGRQCSSGLHLERSATRAGRGRGGVNLAPNPAQEFDDRGDEVRRALANRAAEDERWFHNRHGPADAGRHRRS